MSRPAPVIVPNSIADKLNWEIDWDTPSGYVSTNEYVRPWDREGWGANDVVITPPRNPGGYVPPSRPGIQEGQRDYVFMPTEKEQWRTGDENKRRQALAVGKDWREARLPRKEREVTIQPVYKDWREVELPTRDTDKRLYAGGGSPIKGVSGHDYLNDPKYKDHREKKAYGKPVMPPKKDIKGGGRGRSHKDFDHRGGFNTQALVPWINRETGERWTASDGGYFPREGSGWERERGNSKKDDRGYRVFPSDNESRRTRRPSLRDTLVGDMRRSWR